MEALKHFQGRHMFFCGAPCEKLIPQGNLFKSCVWVEHNIHLNFRVSLVKFLQYLFLWLHSNIQCLISIENRTAEKTTQKHPTMGTYRWDWVTYWAVKEWKSLAMWFLFLFVHQITVPGTLPTTARMEAGSALPFPALSTFSTLLLGSRSLHLQLRSTCDLRGRKKERERGGWDALLLTDCSTTTVSCGHLMRRTSLTKSNPYANVSGTPECSGRTSQVDLMSDLIICDALRCTHVTLECKTIQLSSL